MVAAEPSLLTQKHEQLKLRAEFFASFIGGSPAELATVPPVTACNRLL